jgi:hypothetical protein
MDSYILHSNLKWDYTDIGDISNYIVDNSSTFENDIYTLNIRVKRIPVVADTECIKRLPVIADTEQIHNVRIVVEPFNSILIASDLIKCYFGAFTMRYHICNIGDKKCLISRYENNHWLENINDLNDVVKNELRKEFIAQWLIGNGTFAPKKIMIRTHPVAGMYPTAYIQQYNSNKKFNEKFIKTWFGTIGAFYDEVYKLTNTREIIKISLDIREILLKYSPDDICWKKNIIDRLNLAKNNIL